MAVRVSVCHDSIDHIIMASWFILELPISIHVFWYLVVYPSFRFVSIQFDIHHFNSLDNQRKGKIQFDRIFTF
ncbi:hypothetical protein DERF_000363 [Dermatophagoides farinae]|uniref:Uncharacterized protein n=1 Tax=Dermatophagoides farinae TaxID=6954 RepID=A0A922I8I4_DERFA|nr:hypothetical protein DERF_000363 [Dermatophagoides farinae]